MEGREESDLKEEGEKKETCPAEERREEEEKDSEVKEEKSGVDQRREQKDGNWVKGLIADREKVAEEKEKDKETPTAAEAADAKAKSELVDLKKGGSEARVTACTYTHNDTLVQDHHHPHTSSSSSSTSSAAASSLSWSSLVPPVLCTHQRPVRMANSAGYGGTERWKKLVIVVKRG